MGMTRRERLEATIRGEAVDRPAVALWRHFPGDDQRAGDLARAHLAFQARYDFDLMKVSPSSSYCLEDGGVVDRSGNRDDGSFDARCELMLDVAFQTLRSDPELKLCEGLRLIEATRTAVSRLAPAAADHFERDVLPQMRSALMERFGLNEWPANPIN